MVLALVVTAVTFPRLARRIAAGEGGKARRGLESDLRVISTLVLVAVAYLLAFAPVVVRVLFERGRFTAADTAVTAAIMRVYLLGLLGHALVGALSRPFFSATRPTWYPAAAMVGGLLTTAGLAAVAVGPWGAPGIAGANAAGISLTAAALLVGLRRRMVAVSPVAYGVSLGRLVAAAGGAAVVGWAGAQLLGGLPPLAVALAGGLVVSAAFALLALVTAGPDVRRLVPLGVRWVLPPTRRRRTHDDRADESMDDGGPGPMPPVLMYHSVTRYDADPLLITVSPSRFAEQMRLLHRLGITGTSVQRLLRAAEEHRPGVRVGLTFDDGYGDFVTNVLPVLRQYGFTATVFAVAGSLGGDNHWDPAVPRKALLTAEQLREVAAAGMEIGSHGMRHASLPWLDRAALRTEVERSRAILQALSGQPVAGFCYPYGDAGPREVDAVRAAGYHYGCAVGATQLAGRYALPRSYVGERDGPVRLFGKWLRHRLSVRRAVRRWAGQRRAARRRLAVRRVALRWNARGRSIRDDADAR
jgi:peptidoglycan/xylan/chitin deacetylase (PgdA/CDA1 family)